MADNINISKINKDSDKDSDKYKVTLKFVNSILSNIGKDNIDDLTKFVNIDREGINNEANIIMLKAMENEFGPLFPNKKSTYYKNNKNPVLNFLKAILKDMGYKLCGREYKKQQNRMVKCTTIYTIIKL